MRLGSLFDGSGGFPLAGSLCGITPTFASEVEPYPIAVTTSRFPNMRHIGDVSKINGAEINPVDIITFGSPCQDLSVAGKRAGLKHEANGDEETTRSGLFMEAVRIIKEMRRATNGEYPTFAVWENVPGAFSSNKGEDFRIVCEELIKIAEPSAVMPAVPKNGWPYSDCYCGDGWSLAYRTIDAQYWGVPQRRRRIYLVADFRGERAGKVLFEREGLRGYFEKGRTPWQGTPGDAEDCPGATDCQGEGFDGYNGDLTGNMAATLGVNCGLSTGRNGVIQPIPYTLKIRSGCAIDSGGKAAGKGALIQENKAATLAVSQDQYLFQPVSIENHPADSRVNIDDSGKVQTLTSRMGTGGGNVPMVMEPVAFDGANITSPLNKTNPQPGDPCHTLSTDSRNYVVYESHPMDSRIKELDGVAPTVSRKWHKGGADTPLVCESQPVICLQGNGIDRADTAGCNGKGWKEDVCYTLNTIDRPAVAYGIETFHCTAEEESVPTLKARDWKDPHVVCYREDAPVAIDRAAFNQGQNAQYDPQYLTDGTAPTLVARGPSAVAHKTEIRYIVRRLTPTECARLQGFPDTWGHINPKEDFTDEEYSFWLEVRNTHAAINGKTTKEYTKEQMLTWYNKLHTDSAEYKMWGNGIALPTALYVMQGIADALTAEEEVTDLSDAPEDIKAQLVANDALLRKREEAVAEPTIDIPALVAKLRSTKSVSKRKMLDDAADVIEMLMAKTAVHA